MKKTLKDIKQEYLKLTDQIVELNGWVRNNRAQKEFGFLVINDGTHFDTIQIVYEEKLDSFKDIQKIRAGAAIKVIGKLILTPNAKQAYEIKANSVELLGDSLEDYPIQPKRHTREFLREVAHLRSRTNLFNAIFRLRSVAAFAIHQFFQDKNFIYVNTPIITGNDGEGAGQAFTVTTLPLDKIPLDKEKKVDYSKDFFAKQTSLAVTGQLEAESFALAFSKIYTFGPTFRAENSNTQKHASEFWMIEPEIAFCDLDENIDIIENMVKYIIKNVMQKLPEEMAFFDEFVEKGLIARLNKVVESDFPKITHEEAISILKKSKEKFENEPKFGEDIYTEHERYLTDIHFKSPVFITNWPKDIKAFYMKLNSDDKTVAAVDLLVPKSGELVGGSQREENYEKLLNRMKHMNIPIEGLEWYLDLRKYGGCVHSGFGMGFERLLMFLSGVENIRDVVPFPRTPKNCDF